MNKKTKQFNLWLKEYKKAITICVSLVVVLGAGVFGALYYFNIIGGTSEGGQPESQEVVQARVEQSKKDGKLRDEAASAAKAGDTAKSAEVYKQAVEAEPNVERKVQLQLDQSGVLYAAGKYDEAIAAAKVADAFSEDKFLLADWLSRLYEARQNYPEAIKYYKIAGDWAKSGSNKTGISKEQFYAEAVRVQTLVKTGKE